MRFLIIPTIEVKQKLIQLLEPHVLDFNGHDAQHLIELWIEAEIERRSKYCKNGISTFKLGNLTYWNQLGDDIDLMMYDLIQDFIPHNTWTIYHRQTFPTYIVIEKGIDYRIADWEARMASGEWERD